MCQVVSKSAVVMHCARALGVSIHHDARYHGRVSPSWPFCSMWHSVMAIFYRIQELEECRLKLKATLHRFFLHYDMRSMMRLLHWVGLCKATKLNASLSNVTVLKSIFAGALRGCCSSIGRYMEDEEDQESFARSLSSLGSL